MPTKVECLVTYLKSALKFFLTTRMRLAMKNKYYFTQSRGDLRKTLTKYLDNDTLILDEFKRYERFLGARKSTNDKANSLCQARAKRGGGIISPSDTELNHGVQKCKPKDSIFVILIFAMKYNINVPFIELIEGTNKEIS